MRVNIYAEEMTDRVELIHKEIDGHRFTAVRFYLELPCTIGKNLENVRGPFIHRPGDDDSSAVTFWGKRDLRGMLQRAIDLLDEHYASEPDLLTAAKAVLAGLNARIDAAATVGGKVPVFDGIADLHSAIRLAEGQQ